ncbi:MAG: [FeFe] hydrogenase H-cluster radical SAM maturase HydE [Spirochaetaceae bacterium]|nr:[FeFe] hydrogenase H-cluster radical SAM maturase HydE [Spirochaetaceae bacterium]
MNIQQLLTQLETTHQATPAGIEYLLANEAEQDLLFAAAERVRRNYVGNSVQLRAVIEFSNYCKCRCVYCGINFGNDKLPKFRLTKEQILSAADSAAKAGYKTFVLQSGEDESYTKEYLAEIIAEITQKYGDTAITLSVGERPYSHYEAWFKAGAKRFLLKHEIGNAELYKKLHHGDLLSDRLQAARNLMQIGYQTGSGILIGLPEQTLADIAADILFLQNYNFNMISIGVFISGPGTPLAGHPNGDVGLTKRAMALARLLCPKALIPATSALLSLLPSPEQAMDCGANVLMQKAEPANYENLYALYPRKSDELSIAERRAKVTTMLAALGRTVSETQGNYGEELK